ncbi:MAG: peptide-methionine (S)-S-oxide reductase MsrA [Candidatus Gracilibacteria bacterium]|nr:peptide-methionine (S)-S-oxide reductase MsrA [Candidatus Gracilibacteria bacterium]
MIGLGIMLLGILFLAIGIAIISGYYKVIETKVLNSGYFDVTAIEQKILDKVEEKKENNKLNNNIMENKNINSLLTEGFSPLNLSEAYFAGGCFWCMEGIFEAQEGVQEAIAGYIGGNKKTANYSDVSSGNTKHREGVKIIYDPNIISYEKLSELFWTQIDPTDSEGQFADKGFHYTTAMFYSNSEEKDILEKSKKSLENSGKFDKKIVTKILEKQEFFGSGRISSRLL